MIGSWMPLKLTIIFAALMLSACRAVVDTTVNKDGSGELRTAVVFSAEEKKNFDGAPNNAGKSICESLRSDTPPEVLFLEEMKGEDTYCTTVHPFQTLKQLRDFYEGMANVTVNDLRLGLGRFMFNVQVDLTPQNANEAAPNEWRLTVPGEIRNHNADMIDRNTLVWNIKPGEVRILQAESAVGPDLLTLVLVGGLIVLLGILFAVWLAPKSRKAK
ncbi:MAG TPA: hypothetical protein VFR47_15870 [Anaerolineales bacterium]|nr:hypothetical protein [Anaerolineales bacterium]